jgi:O-succinylbenzoic acid--CoA ligase
MQHLLCPIAKSAFHSPNSIAIHTESTSISYQDLEAKISSIQHYFKSLSLTHKRIGLIAHISIETIVFYFAALREGFSVCMLNPKDPPSLLKEKIEALDLHYFHPCLTSASSSKQENIYISENHLSTYLYTSGSSSKPKIACLSFKNHYLSALGILSCLKLTSSSRYLLSLPLYHVSGLSILFRTFLSGATLILSSQSELSLHSLINERISHLSLVSTQYLRLLKTLSSPYPDLKAILLGGSSFPQTLLEEGLLKNLPLYLSYGLTEMSSAVCCNSLLETQNIFSSGDLLPYRKLSVDSTGEVLVSGETLFIGYYCTQRKKILPQTSWFNTGDLGHFSKEKGLVLQGRKDDLIISGGENIQPKEIEHLLLSIEGVHQAAIITLPDEEFGQKMVAIIHSTSSLCFKELSKKLSSFLPNYKLPKCYLPWPEELKSSSLKLSASLKQSLAHYAKNATSIDKDITASL